MFLCRLKSLQQKSWVVRNKINMHDMMHFRQGSVAIYTGVDCMGDVLLQRASGRT